ncbi:hypothetical protein AB0M46_42690 [Dactylosporangium sp. NPDC051485]|uniref:hypothetical protein n=1 Tax=Dactylosporangium sp. NPDC051485 TaxID=3154846 RepID=UPI003415A3DD
MTTPLVRAGAVAAPALMFGYGTLRLLDGMDGHYHKGSLLWNAGHVMFFAAIVLLAAMAVAARALLPLRDVTNRLVTDLAVVATVAGSVAFLWVITGDLNPGFPALPDALQTAGPAAFQLGLLALLVQLVRGRRLPAWSPVAVLFAFLLIIVSLDLIPLGGILLFVGLLPLAGVARAANHGPRAA